MESNSHHHIEEGWLMTSAFKYDHFNLELFRRSRLEQGEKRHCLPADSFDFRPLTVDQQVASNEVLLCNQCHTNGLLPADMQSVLTNPETCCQTSTTPGAPSGCSKIKIVQVCPTISYDLVKVFEGDYDSISGRVFLWEAWRNTVNDQRDPKPNFIQNNILGNGNVNCAPDCPSWISGDCNGKTEIKLVNQDCAGCR